MPPCLLFTFFPININIDFVINLLFSSRDRCMYILLLLPITTGFLYTADQKKKKKYHIMCTVQTPTAEGRKNLIYI